MTESRWTTGYLEGLRLKGDPLGDETIASILAENDGVLKVNDLFNKLVTGADLKDGTLPPSLENFFTESAKLPAWADKKLLLKGTQVFGQYGPEMSTLLLCKALPECYACGKGAKVLHLTGQLSEHSGSLKPFTRRLMETSQFVVNVMAPNSLISDGIGMVTTQKVRLIHSAIRHYCTKRGWDTATYGLPINQEDLAGTLMGFSALILDGLRKLDIQLTPDEEEGYFHRWRVAGHIIGLDDELIPENSADGLELGNAILAHQVNVTPEGIELNDACMDFIDHILPGTKFDGVARMFVRHLIGDQMSDAFGIEKAEGMAAKIYLRLERIGEDVEKVKDHLGPLVKFLLRGFNRALLQGMIHFFNYEKGIYFHIPESLHHQWNLKPEWKDEFGLRIPLTEKRLSFQRKNTDDDDMA